MAEGEHKIQQKFEVTVARHGNSRAFPLPAALGRTHQAEIGSLWRIATEGASIVYSPVRRDARELVIEGAGTDRVGLLDDADVSAPENWRDSTGFHTWDEV